ncbi:hypothetical protein B0T17DRAFT_581268, partial [Bombardia bombarda]
HLSQPVVPAIVLFIPPSTKSTIPESEFPIGIECGALCSIGNSPRGKVYPSDITSLYHWRQVVFFFLGDNALVVPFFFDF